MDLGFNWDELKKQWGGATGVFDGTKIWDPFRREYIPVPPKVVPPSPDPTLSAAGPNSTNARLQHVEMLRASGVITDQEAAELRRRITSGM